MIAMGRAKGKLGVVGAMVLLLSLALLMPSCKSKKGGGVSSATGWKYNDPKYGGFEVVEMYQPKTAPGLVFIEGGTFIMGRTDQDVVYDWNNTPRRVTVTSYYIDEFETTNVVYREYLHWLARVMVSYPEVYNNAKPDTLVWRSPLGYNEPLVENYFRHPAYNEHPVVGVSWQQAMDFALWRSNRVNELMLLQNGVLEEISMTQQDQNNFDTDAYLLYQYEPEHHKGLPSKVPGQEETSRHVQLDDGIMFPKYRLPTEAEWEFAASGLMGNTVEETVAERKLYPWNGHNVRNGDPKHLGKMMANFVRGKGDYMGTAGNLNDKGDITLPVDSFWPNDYGLYAMAGNVNEWVLDVYRPLTFEDMDEFRPFRGNIFQTNKLNDPNDPKSVVLNERGQIEKRPITPEEATGRPNYDQAYYVNYKDGDVQSSARFLEGGDIKNEVSTTNMYYQGDTAGVAPNAGMTTLINDHSRVYKGGGWRDRAYWLSPGARRFLDQNACASDIGFRLAMDAVGQPAAEDRNEKPALKK